MMYVLLSIIGLVFGSFYLVVATRMPNEESLVFSRSHCDNCSHVLAWYELIPVISYLIQKGRCRKCGSKITILAPLVEIITAACFSLSFYLYGFDYKFYALVVLLSLVIIVFISDFKYYIINDVPLFTTITLIIILKVIFFGFEVLPKTLIAGLVLFLIFLGIKFFGDKAFKKESLGGGDVKLAILIGVTLGIKLGLTAFILSAFIALPYALFASVKSDKAIVPFGPFLMTSIIAVFLFMPYFEKIINYLFAF